MVCWNRTSYVRTLKKVLTKQNVSSYPDWCIIDVIFIRVDFSKFQSSLTVVECFHMQHFTWKDDSSNSVFKITFKFWFKFLESTLICTIWGHFLTAIKAYFTLTTFKHHIRPKNVNFHVSLKFIIWNPLIKLSDPAGPQF